MSNQNEYPDTVSITDAKKRAKEKCESRAGYSNFKVGEEIVRAAFGGEIPDRAAVDRLNYDVYDNFDSYKSTAIVGVQIKTRKAPGNFNKFYRGTRNSDRHDKTLDAEKVRNKWEEVLEHAQKVKEKKEKKKKRKKKRKEKKEKIKSALSDLREELGMKDYGRYFSTENDFRGEMRIEAKGVNLTLKGLTPDQTEEVMNLVRSFQ